MPNTPDKPTLISVRHPYYTTDSIYWQQWRETYEGGDEYVRNYLKRFSDRETQEDFNDRIKMTPVPAFAKSALNDVRNSIFQRLADVLRRDGTDTYAQAMEGNNGGVDNVGDQPITLEMDRIPFTLLDIKGSILKDVSMHQKALLNLGSSDISYALKSNFPFYVEQSDSRNIGAHLKDYIEDDGTTTTSKNEKPGRDVTGGVTHGRTYSLKAERPSFINPSSEPLEASMKLQEKLEDDIRKLVNLSVQNKVGQRVTSAEALKLSDQGLEAGLSYIGLVLEGAERHVAEYWAAYESRDKNKRKVALVKYPDRYSLKDNADRIDEAEKLSELMDTVPGKTVKKEVAKSIAVALLSGRVSVAKLDVIFKEIDDAKYTTSDAEIILKSVEGGLCSEKVGSEAIGFADGVYLQARLDHAARAKRVPEAQTSAKAEQGNMAARGMGDLDADKESGKEEREEATDTTTSEDKKKPQRGEGKSLSKGE